MVQTSNVARNIQENLNYDTIKLHQNTLKGWTLNIEWIHTQKGREMNGGKRWIYIVEGKI